MTKKELLKELSLQFNDSYFRIWAYSIQNNPDLCFVKITCPFKGSYYIEFYNSKTKLIKTEYFTLYKDSFLLTSKKLVYFKIEEE